MKYQPQLDGIRGLAVLAVVAFHATSLMPGGWLGVDVFFVLSGFLITTLIVSEYERTGAVAMRAFYWRRFLRLAPPLLVTLVLSIPIMLWLTDERTYSAGTVALGVAGYAANWMQVADPTSLGPLSHTWSLAIEEQFYLVWPALLLVALKRGLSTATIARGTAAVVILLVILRASLGVVVEADHLWFSTFSRGDALLIGAVLALSGKSIRGARASAAGVAAVALLGAASLTADEFAGWMIMGGLTGVALAAAFLIASREAPALTPVLSWTPLRWVGMVSYGLYLYHYPLFFIANHADVTSAQAWAIKIGGTAIITVASWYLMEEPLKRLRHRSTRSGSDAVRRDHA